MKDRTLPLWIRLAITFSALSQIVFGVTLLFNPAAITRLWPWTLTPLDTRLLGASTLVAVPLSLLAALANRWSVARIPFVMQLAYRVVQLIAGFMHLSRFDFSRPVTWNYFGGGAIMGLIFAYGLLRGWRIGQAVEGEPRWVHGDAPLHIGVAGRTLILVFAVLYLALGAVFFILGAGAANFWFEPVGKLTTLTARLFASPTTGLVLALWLITRAKQWREILVPASGMVTFGLSGVLAFILGWQGVAPPTWLGYVTAATPAVLMLIGLYLLMPARRAQVERPVALAG